MKERIIIDEDFWVKHFQEREIEFQEEDMCSGGNPEDWWHYRKEQIPETWEELKELCEKLCEKIKVIEVYTEYISCHKFLFWKNGAISSETDDGEEIVYISDRTPQQMWEIIKNLTGEQ